MSRFPVYKPCALLLLAATLLPRPAAAEEIPVPVIAVQAAEPGAVPETFSLTGSVTARRSASLSSRIPGLVEKLRVDAGSVVKKGEELMCLDTALVEIERDAVETEIEAAEIELAEAERRYEDIRELAERGGFPRTEAETLKSTAKVRKAARDRLLVERRELAERIDRHRLVAPFAGVIHEKHTEEGEWVDEGDPVVQLVETEDPWFDIQVPQESLARIRRAKKVSVRLDAAPERTFPAEIAVSVPVKDPVSRTFLVRLRLQGAEDLAAPGMSGTAHVEASAARKDSVWVPRDSVVRFPDGSAKVWTVSGYGDDVEVESREVVTGKNLDTQVEILEGLKGGEFIILKGNEGLREEQRVRAQPATENNAP